MKVTLHKSMLSVVLSLFKTGSVGHLKMIFEK